MIRFSNLCLVVLVLALLLGLSMPVLGAESAGKIKSVDAGKKEFVMADSAAKNWTFHLTNDAKVFINDKEATLSDLQVDNEVAVTYEKNGEKLMASVVRCTRK